MTAAKVFLDDASGGGARFCLTGDVGRLLPDGCIELLGRKDFQVKIRGYRIETAEIEFALLQHGQVREVAVVACNDERGDKSLVAYVVGAGVQKEKLRAHLKARLPDYMLPSALVVLDALPLTPNGKLDRKALPQPASTCCDAVAYAPPRTPTEEKLAAIYADILRLDRVGIDDNFFELGGHSLFATQVIARVNKTLNVDIQLRALFESPTVAGLSALIVQSQAEAQDQVSQPRKKTIKV